MDTRRTPKDRVRRRRARGLGSVLAVVATVAMGAGATALPLGATPTSLPAAGAGFVGSPPTMCPAPLDAVQSDAPSVRGAARTVALTFDDGPGRSTQAILDILEAFHVRATFFNVGQEEVYRPELVQEEARDGFLLGDHTVDHPVMQGLGATAQAAEIDGVLHETRLLTQTSACVFRPPYGSYDSTTVALAVSRHMSFWTWNVSTDDWEARGSGSQAWVRHIVSTAEAMGLATDHAVVLFHNQPIAMPATVAALPMVIRFFQRHGYAFVDLLGRTGWPGTCGAAGVGPPPVALAAVDSGRGLAAGAALTSPGGQFTLVQRGDGDLVLRLATGRVLFSTRTAGSPGAILRVQPDGDVVVTQGARVLWSTGTAGHPGARLVLGADGDLRVASGAATWWDAHTTLHQLLPGERLLAGWRLTSPDGRCRLVQQAAGPLQLLDATGQVLFTPGTARSGTMTVLVAGGDLLQVLPGAAPSWDSVTAQHGATRTWIDDTGRLDIATLGGHRLWVTP